MADAEVVVQIRADLATLRRDLQTLQNELRRFDQSAASAAQMGASAFANMDQKIRTGLQRIKADWSKLGVELRAMKIDSPIADSVESASAEVANLTAQMKLARSEWAGLSAAFRAPGVAQLSADADKAVASFRNLGGVTAKVGSDIRASATLSADALRDFHVEGIEQQFSRIGKVADDAFGQIGAAADPAEQAFFGLGQAADQSATEIQQATTQLNASLDSVESNTKQLSSTFNRMDNDATNAFGAITVSAQQAGIAVENNLGNGINRFNGMLPGVRRNLSSLQGQVAPINQSLNSTDEAFHNFANAAEVSGRNLQLTQFAAQNLGYQVNDLATVLIAGQNPLIAFTQQGAQISQLFGPNVGIGAALRTTGVAMVQFLTNPVFLASAALGGLFLAGKKAFDEIVSGSQEAEKTLKRLDGVLEGVKDRFGDAGEAVLQLGEIAGQGVSVAGFEAEQVFDKLTKMMDESTSNLTERLEEPAERLRALLGQNLTPRPIFQPELMSEEKFRQITEAWEDQNEQILKNAIGIEELDATTERAVNSMLAVTEKFRVDLQNGEADARTFRETLSKIATALPPGSPLRDVIEGIVTDEDIERVAELSEQLEKARVSADLYRRAAEQLPPPPSPQVAVLEAFAGLDEQRDRQEELLVAQGAMADAVSILTKEMASGAMGLGEYNNRLEDLEGTYGKALDALHEFDDSFKEQVQDFQDLAELDPVDLRQEISLDLDANTSEVKKALVELMEDYDEVKEYYEEELRIAVDPQDIQRIQSQLDSLEQARMNIEQDLKVPPFWLQVQQGMRDARAGEPIDPTTDFGEKVIDTLRATGEQFKVDMEKLNDTATEIVDVGHQAIAEAFDNAQSGQQLLQSIEQAIAEGNIIMGITNSEIATLRGFLSISAGLGAEGDGNGYVDYDFLGNGPQSEEGITQYGTSYTPTWASKEPDQEDVSQMQAEQTYLRTILQYKKLEADQVQTITRRLAELELALAKASLSLAGLGGSAESGPGSGLAGGYGTSGSSIGGYASGGMFKVGGSGGVDSQMVKFFASPDEHVAILTSDQYNKLGKILRQFGISEKSFDDADMKDYKRGPAGGNDGGGGGSRKGGDGGGGVVNIGGLHFPGMQKVDDRAIFQIRNAVDRAVKTANRRRNG